MAPSIMEKQPEPRAIQMKFHGKSILVWEGKIHICRVHGWARNPRIDVELKQFMDDHANREPNDDEIYSIMKEVGEFELKDLAADIRVNGIRSPIIVAADGTLVDGNRRYFATRLALDKLSSNDDALRSELEKIPVRVLDESCTEEDVQYILVQENFYPGLKLEWPHYVKATRIYADLLEDVPVDVVAKRYNWKTAAVNETRRIMELIDEFIVFATDSKDGDEGGLGLSDIEAQRVAATNYQFFNEAQKSLRQRLAKDAEFKFQFFRWIHEGKFSNWQEVRIAADAWDNAKARKVLCSDDPKAAKKARAIVEYEKNLEKTSEDAEETINEFVKFLQGLTTTEKAKLSPEAVNALETSLSIVVYMVKASRK